MKRISFFLVLTLTLLFVGCEEDVSTNVNFIGNWQLVEIVVDGQQQTLSSRQQDSTLNFIQDGIMELCGQSDTIRSGWDYNNGILYISKHLPASYTVESIDINSLKVSRLDFNALNSVTKTSSTFKKID